MRNAGAGLTVGVTAPLLALGAAAIKNFDEQAKAIAQVEQGIRSTGAAVGFTTEELKKQAAELQNNSLFGDENILKNVTAQLLTFTGITNEQFSRTQQAALDLATRLDGDLKGAAIQLGKALNDPITNLSALSRSGIQFSKDQKELIKTLVETGKVAEAQGIILDELEKQYGGSASAAARAGLGPFTQLKNILGDITEEFGEIILEGVKPLLEQAKSLVLRFQELSPATKKFLVIFSGIAAAVGPLLALAGTILPAIGTGLTLLSGPIGLIVAGLTAIGVVIYKNWEPIKATLVDIANYFIDLYNESTVFRLAVEGIRSSFENIYDVGSFVFGVLGNIISTLAKNIKQSFQDLGAIVKAVLTGNIEEIPQLLANNFKESTKNFKELIENATKDFNVLKKDIEGNVTEGIERALTGKKYKLLSKNVDTEELTEKVSDAVVKGIDKGTQSGTGNGRIKVPTLQLETQGIAQVGDLDISSQVGEIFAPAVVDENLTGFLGRLEYFNDESKEILESSVSNFAVGFGDIIGAIATGSAGLEDIGSLLLNTMADIAQQLGESAIKIGVTMKALKFSFKNPFAAIAAGVGLVALSSILRGVAGKFAGNFADGGMVGGTSFTGDKLLAGVNSGELILNVAQQKNLANSIRANSAPIILQPSLGYDGNELKVFLNRVDNKNSRLT